MVRSRINKSRYLLNKKRVSKRKKSMLKGGETINYSDGRVYNGEVIDCQTYLYSICRAVRPIDYMLSYLNPGYNSIKNGLGTQVWPTGEVYEGEWKDDKKHGRGKNNWPNGNVYDGEWNDDKMNGIGTHKWPSGDVYDGQWKDNKITGIGKFTWVNGSVYDGEWNDGKMNGIGTKALPNGEVYEGEWKDDKKHGRGKMTWPDDKFYEGEWRDDNMNGRGTQTWPTGEVYEGEWKDGKTDGRGKMTWPDGKFYEGEWNDGKINGIGKHTWPGGKFYEGEWKDAKKHGRGKNTWPDRKVYEGEWRDDKMNGRGKMTWPDGNVYDGEWKDDEITNFILISPNGKFRKEYIFTNGKLYNFENNIDKYRISNPKWNMTNKYITILINLHGSDIINSNCILARNHHVRCISPVKCGYSNISDPKSLKDAFQIAYNISHLQDNSAASTYQKIMKIIEVYNENNSNFYNLQEGAFRKPIIDHLYNSEIKDNYKEIFIIDTNLNTPISHHNYELFIQKNKELITIQDIEQYNILQILLKYLRIDVVKNFLRSNLINILLDFGYDTINIIDFSCRNIQELIQPENNTSGKNFVCNYKQNIETDTRFDDDTITSVYI
jgi:hypothetical protein